MKIVKHTSLVVADKVVAEMRKLLVGVSDERFESEMDMSPFLNGREKGYFITSYPIMRLGLAVKAKKGYIRYPSSRVVAIAENRSSDNIVVYTASDKELDYPYMELPDSAYENAKYFEPDNNKEAAEYILKYLLSK